VTLTLCSEAESVIVILAFTIKIQPTFKKPHVKLVMLPVEHAVARLTENA
jgi:hypothetical protein